MYVQPETLMYTLVGTGFGVYWFFSGFRELKSSRTIENIPTSRIATGAVGTNVEIKGKILIDGEMLKAPISGNACPFYSIEIQKLVKTKNSTRWVRVDQFYSEDHFHLDDGSGALAQVFVAGATILRNGGNRTFRTHSRNFSSMPLGLRSALEENAGRLRRFRLQETSFWFSREYRFIEWCFLPGETVYVLGFAESGLRVTPRRKLKFANFLLGKKQIEADHKLQQHFDSNQDGVLDENEMERGAQVVGLKLQEAAAPAVVEESGPQAKLIFRKRKPHPFFISNMKEEDLVKRLSWKAVLKLWGGPALALACSGYIFWMLSQNI